MPGRGFTSTVTVWPLSPNALGGKSSLANSIFSGGPWRSTIVLGVPVTKVTEVSDGCGPAVSSTITRGSGRMRDAWGVAVSGAAGARRALHAAATIRNVAPSDDRAVRAAAETP